MSGTTFTVVFAADYALLAVLEAFILRETGQTQFYLVGVPYFVFVMFCLVGYRSKRELCFYCVFTLVSNFAALLWMLAFSLKTWPSAYFWLCGVVFAITVLVRGFKNQEQRRRRERRD